MSQTELMRTGPPPGTAAAIREAGDDGFEALHPNARWGFRLAQCVPVLALSVPLLLVVRSLLARQTGALPATLIVGALIVLLLAWTWRFAERRFRAVRLRLDDDGLSVHRGVIWQSETHVPRSRVQHTDIERGPLDRQLGLADLVVHTAGTRMATVRIAGLASDRALALRDALLEGHDQRF